MPGRGKSCTRAVLIFTGCPSQDGRLLFERATHAVAREEPVQPYRRNEQHHDDGRSDDEQNLAHGCQTTSGGGTLDPRSVWMTP